MLEGVPHDGWWLKSAFGFLPSQSDLTPMATAWGHLAASRMRPRGQQHGVYTVCIREARAPSWAEFLMWTEHGDTDWPAPEAASEAERAQGGVSKGRYLRFRDEASSTKSLGFRIDAVQLSEECDASEIPTINELRLCATRDQVRDTCAKYLQHRRSLLLSFLEQMRELRATLETCDVFKTHSFIRSSLLFVYDGSTDRTLIRMIDLARVQPAPPLEGAAGSVGGNGGGYPGGELEATPPPRPLSHRAEWRAGNGEDGYLTGLDNMIDIFEGLLSDASVQ